MARSIYALATGLPAGDAAAKVAAQQAALTVDATLVETALDCFVKNASCPFFADVIGVSSSDLEGLTGGGSLSLYTSVYNEPYNLGTGFYLSPTVAERFARQLLAKVSGDAIARCDSDTACKSVCWLLLIGWALVYSRVVRCSLTGVLNVPSECVLTLPCTITMPCRRHSGQRPLSTSSKCEPIKSWARTQSHCTLSHSKFRGAVCFLRRCS